MTGAWAGSPEYFTLYEVRNAEILASQGYLARLNSPTASTTSSVAHFRHVARSPRRIDVSTGLASSGFLATLRCDADPVHDTALLARLQTTLAEIAHAPGRGVYSLQFHQRS